jgi:hypothetical protein
MEANILAAVEWRNHVPEPEEELRPGTAMVSSRPEGEVAPIRGDKTNAGRKG